MAEKPGPSDDYKALLRAEITCEEYLKRMKADVDQKMRNREIREVAVGSRVTMIGHDTPYSGEQGVVTNSPGTVFNGWTVRLDSGPVIGVDRRYLRVDELVVGNHPRKRGGEKPLHD